MITHRCQVCSSSKLTTIIDLGYHPLADTFLSEKQLTKGGPSYPLRVLQCSQCGFTTLYCIVPAEKRYQESDYSYTSSNSSVAIKHFTDMADQIIERQAITKDNLVVDIGSNDGTLLQSFKEKTQCNVIGVEPSKNIALQATNKGIPSINDFFNHNVVTQISKDYENAKIITATNVFNHITDLNTFLSDIYRLLSDDGVFVIETPYLLHLVRNYSFDTIYLEHVSYFSIRPFRELFRKHKLYIQYFEENDYMGGSIRLYVGKGKEATSIVEDAIAREDAAMIHDVKTYVDFENKIQALKNKLLKEIQAIKEKNGKIIGIGAATKGNTLLNYCGIDATMLDFITDQSPLKIGRYTPGSNILIKSDEDITPDITHALILPWNIGGFLKEKLKHLNLEFIIPRINK